MRFSGRYLLVVAALVAASLLLGACAGKEQEGAAVPGVATEVTAPTEAQTAEAEPSASAVLASPTAARAAATAPAAQAGRGDGGPGVGVPMFRGNAARTGENPGPGVEHSPKLLWRFKTDGDIYSSPAVVDGVVYIGSTDWYL